MTALHRTFGPLLAAIFCCAVPAAGAQEADVAAAEQLLNTNRCSKCHSADRQKDGPSYKSIAAKYKGQKDAEAKLVKHMTSSPVVEIDGIKEQHVNIKSSDAGAIRNVARYVLSR